MSHPPATKSSSAPPSSSASAAVKSQQQHHHHGIIIPPSKAFLAQQQHQRLASSGSAADASSGGSGGASPSPFPAASSSSQHHHASHSDPHHLHHHAHSSAASNGAASSLPATSAPTSTTPSATPSSVSSSHPPAHRPTRLHGSSRSFAQDYTLLPSCLLGSGATGSVYLCTSKRNPTHEYAVKVIKLEEGTEFNMAHFNSEMQILSTIHHRNIIRLHAVYTTSTAIHIVTELASGGELFDRIMRVHTFSERDVIGIMRKLFHAVSYLHSRGIVHRDLKPENVIFSTKDINSEVKIVDFGLSANLLLPSHNLRAKTREIGSTGFIAPEILAGKEYDEKADLWSLGIIAYIMLCGLPPYVTLEDTQGRKCEPYWIYLNSLKTSNQKPVEFRDELGWRGVSSQAKQFLSCVLELDPKKRMRSIDACNHVWLKKGVNIHAEKNVSGTMMPSTAVSLTQQSEAAASSPPSSSSISSSSSSSETASSQQNNIHANRHDQHSQMGKYLTMTFKKKDFAAAAAVNTVNQPTTSAAGVSSPPTSKSSAAVPSSPPTVAARSSSSSVTATSSSASSSSPPLTSTTPPQRKVSIKAFNPSLPMLRSQSHDPPQPPSGPHSAAQSPLCLTREQSREVGSESNEMVPLNAEVIDLEQLHVSPIVTITSQATITHHERDTSTQSDVSDTSTISSSSSSAHHHSRSPSSLTSSFLTRRAKLQAQHYATLPVQYSRDDDDQEEEQDGTKSDQEGD